MIFSAACLLAASCNAFSQSTKAQLEVSETFFTMAAALNSCGYDAGMDESLPLRAAVRAEVQGVLRQSPQAAQALHGICQFWQEHQPEGTSTDVTQYVSLALELGGPPEFTPVLPEADLPPDAAHVLGVASLLRKFYQAAGIHSLWLKHSKEYESLISQFHDPVSEVMVQTDRYLKLPFSSVPSRHFVIYLEPLLSPHQEHARNYGDHYLLVMSPGQDGLLKLHAVRHTYLHYVLEPLALTHGISLKRLEPILLDIRSAPLSDSYKNDIALMVNESLIRAIEVRTDFPKSAEKAREAAMQQSVQEGFIFTHYFYEALANFEKASTGMKDSYGDLLHDIDVEHERKRARETTFVAQATPEIISTAKAFSASNLLDKAEQRLAMADPAGAQTLAASVIDNPNSHEDSGRALFIMARAATLSGDMQSAASYFQKAVEAAHDPRTLAWSHIYLARIFDIQENRDQALAHYQAALQAGDPTPDTKAAAERGLAMPYQPRSPR